MILEAEVDGVRMFLDTARIISLVEKGDNIGVIRYDDGDQVVEWRVQNLTFNDLASIWSSVRTLEQPEAGRDLTQAKDIVRRTLDEVVPLKIGTPAHDDERPDVDIGHC